MVVKKKRDYSCIEPRERGFVNPIKHIKRYGQNIKHAYQRIKYGYCDRDVWSIDWWFLSIVPNMLQDLKETTHGYPSFSDDMSQAIVGTGAPEEVDKEGMRRWQEILSEMIFLFREANSDTCARKNKYEADYDKAVEEFTRKYGEWGEGLKSEEEKTRERKEGLYTMYGLSDVPEYREIDELHHAEFLEIEKYRNECKNKGLDMFKEWFWQLWD